MLVNFRFENCRSFLNKNILSMEATADKELLELNTFSVGDSTSKNGQNELLKSALIFGANASGKSNVLKILSYMQYVVNFGGSQVFATRHNSPFAFKDGAEDKESLYEVEIMHNNNFYRYGFTILHGAIKREWLQTKAQRIVKIFSREDTKVKIYKDNKGSYPPITVSPVNLFLSIASGIDFGIKNYINDVIDWFHKLIFVFTNTNISLDVYDIKGKDYKKEALKILKQADIGIKDINIKKDKVANMANLNEVIRINSIIQSNPSNVGQLKQEATDLYNIDLETVFDVYDYNNKVVGKKNIYLYKDKAFNSEGTERLLLYLGWILLALDNGYVLLMDEIDSKIHVTVAKYIMELFNSISSNPKNAQLITTAHNVLLMDEGLRRDQIYFTTKNKYGESALISLANFKNVRKNDKFFKKYLAGFYVDVPQMSIYR